MNPQLIQRFFKKECTPAEAATVAAFLKKNPSVLEEYLNTEEWNAIPGNDELPEELWNDIWQSIQKKNKKRANIIRLKRFAAAASVIFVIALAVYHLIPEKENVQSIAQEQKAPSIIYKTISNTTKEVMMFMLEDSSHVELSPASSVTFSVPFAKDKRDITLEGEAKFHVAKNKIWPFTVYSGALSTTALGTVFTVTKIAAKNSVVVKLYEGKVVIKSTQNLQGWKDDVYLLPGQQMNFNADKNTVAVNNINNKKSTIIALKQAEVNKDSIDNTLHFKNVLLPRVMQQLSKHFNVKISYDSSEINTINFTGVVTQQDSLPVILKAIGQMNGLIISKDSTGYSILKQQP